MKKRDAFRHLFLAGRALVLLLGSLLVPRPMVYTFIAGHRVSAFHAAAVEIIS
jgi:hypothetical protein